MAYASLHLDPSGVSTEDPREEETQRNQNTIYCPQAPEDIQFALEGQDTSWDISHLLGDADTLSIPPPGQNMTGEDATDFDHSTSLELERTPRIKFGPITPITNFRHEVFCNPDDLRPVPRTQGFFWVAFLNTGLSSNQNHVSYESRIRCDSYEVNFTGKYRNTRPLARHMGGGRDRNLAYPRSSTRAHERHRLRRVALKTLYGSCATLCALGGTDTGQSILSSDYLFRHAAHASTGTATQLLCVAGFIASISFIRRSSPENRHQDLCLILAILVGVAPGVLMRMSIQDTVRRILPWTVIGLLLVSEIMQVLISSSGSSYVVGEKDLPCGFEKC